MKKVLLAIAIVGLVGCGNKAEEKKVDTTKPAVSSTTTTTTTSTATQPNTATATASSNTATAKP